MSNFLSCLPRCCGKNSTTGCARIPKRLYLLMFQILCALVSWALSFGAWHPEGPIRISPFPQLLVPAYLILFWAFSLAFLVMTGVSYLSFQKGPLAFLEEYPGIWGLYAASQLLITLIAMGIATSYIMTVILAEGTHDICPTRNSPGCIGPLVMVFFFLFTISLNCPSTCFHVYKILSRDKSNDTLGFRWSWRWKLKLLQVLAVIPPTTIALCLLIPGPHQISSSAVLHESTVLPYVSAICTSLFLAWQLVAFMSYAWMVSAEDRRSHPFYRNYISMIIFFVMEGLMLIPVALPLALYITYYNVEYFGLLDLTDTGNTAIAFSEGFLGICCLAQLLFIPYEPYASRELRGVLRVEYRAAHPKKVKVAAKPEFTGGQRQTETKTSKMEVMHEPPQVLTVQMRRQHQSGHAPRSDITSRGLHISY